MDRREAIQKLAAGAAVAVGVSAVLSTRDVADHALRLVVGSSGVPGDGEPLPISSSSGNGNGTCWSAMRLQPHARARCPTSTYSWRINSYNVADANTFFGPIAPQFLIKNAADVAVVVAGTNFSRTCSSCPTPYTSPTLTNSTVSFRKRLYIDFFGGIELEQPLEAGDSYDVGLLRTWQCAWAAGALTAEYRISGTYPNAPVVENISYTVGSSVVPDLIAAQLPSAGVQVC